MDTSPDTATHRAALARSAIGPRAARDHEKRHAAIHRTGHGRVGHPLRDFSQMLGTPMAQIIKLLMEIGT